MGEQAKHTAGPWQVMRGRTVAAQGSTDTYGGTVWGGVAYVQETTKTDADGRTWTTDGSAEANARLIAAAPEMLEALREVSAMFFARPDMVKAIQPLMGPAEHAICARARAAIAKATGAAS